ncbi:hypothetical protein SAY86_013873 [Trapa natans]|uniref:Uncharacterized protein n=1 Tax=Trapa natans TaxID=22666 RepID=A0AAN7QQ77_TRANT|nr:hypothetical protein SAY86_013873 [Trapa natans]
MGGSRGFCSTTLRKQSRILPPSPSFSGSMEGQDVLLWVSEHFLRTDLLGPAVRLWSEMSTAGTEKQTCCTWKRQLELGSPIRRTPPHTHLSMTGSQPGTI